LLLPSTGVVVYSNEKEREKKYSAAKRSLVVKKPLQLPLLWEGDDQLFPSGHLGLQFIAGIVKYFVKCHVRETFEHNWKKGSPLYILYLPATSSSDFFFVLVFLMVSGRNV
jgi:hypothetical protein